MTQGFNDAYKRLTKRPRAASLEAFYRDGAVPLISGSSAAVRNFLDAGLQQPGATAPPAALRSLGGVSLAGTAAPA